jgi:DNA primase
MKLSEAGRERLRQASAIEEVVKESGIALRRVGKGLMGLCPFHADKKPSLSVQVSEGHFHCFGCGKGGDVFRFVQAKEGVGFVTAARRLASRAGLTYAELCDGEAARAPRPARASKAAAVPGVATEPATPDEPEPSAGALAAALGRVVDHYHRTFCEREEGREYLAKRGLRDLDVLRALRVGYADGSLLKLVPKTGELREALLALGVITAEGRELLGGCIVVPIPDPASGAWVNLYGRGVKVARHCYLPGQQRGVLNFQAARLSDEVVLAESVLDALSFHQAGVGTAIPIYGTSGFTADMLDLLQRESVRRVVLALDNDEPGKKATAALKEKLAAAGIAVRVASLPAGIKDPNELLVSRNGDAGDAFRRMLDDAEPRPEPEPAPAPAPAPDPTAAAEAPADPIVEPATDPASHDRGPDRALRPCPPPHPRVRHRPQRRPAHAAACRADLPGPGVPAPARPAPGHGPRGEGNGLPRRHHRPLRIKESGRVREASHQGHGRQRRRDRGRPARPGGGGREDGCQGSDERRRARGPDHDRRRACRGSRPAAPP